MAQLVVLAGKGRGAQALAQTETYTIFVPYCVSTVPGATLAEAALRGLEGCCARARHSESSVAQPVVSAGRGKGSTGSVPQGPIKITSKREIL